MNLHDIFTPDRIILRLKAEDKDGAFEELVGRLTEATGIPRSEEFLKVIRDRELVMSTGIKNGVAIPHGKLDGLAEIIGVLGISQMGIDYNSLDNRPVHVIFLFLSPKDWPEEHLALLGGISKFLENRKLVTALRAVRTAESAARILRGDPADA